MELLGHLEEDDAILSLCGITITIGAQKTYHQLVFMQSKGHRRAGCSVLPPCNPGLFFSHHLLHLSFDGVWDSHHFLPPPFAVFVLKFDTRLFLYHRAFQSLLGFQTSPNCPASKVTGTIEPFPARMKPSEGRRNNSSWIRYGALQSVAETMQENGNLIDFHSYIGVHSSDSLKEVEKEDKEEKEEEEEERLVSKRLEPSFECMKKYENSQILLSESTTSWRLDGPTNLFSQEDESIVENEKLRRMRISETNRGHIPWNKGIRYTQG